MLTTCASPHITYCWRNSSSLPSTLRACSAAAWGLEVAFIIVSLGTAQAIFVGWQPPNHAPIGALVMGRLTLSQGKRRPRVPPPWPVLTPNQKTPKVFLQWHVFAVRGDLSPLAFPDRPTAEPGRAVVGLLPAGEEGTVARRSRARRYQTRLRSVARWGFAFGK